ncbi:MAG: hypothetical protein IID14_10050, partial [Candidatus Marinimicrobia bacterium]|nr:hypothetical protein [Candidatus Neomarinimicrobiota bacterium]
PVAGDNGTTVRVLLVGHFMAVHLRIAKPICLYMRLAQSEPPATKNPIALVHELFEEAAQLVISQRQASVSMLQRRFRIGYSRAGRLIDELELAGIISGYSGSKAREVLVDASDREGWNSAHPRG